MGKLITPFVYEDKLSGLAESFPLSLTDEVKQIITLSVCDIQPADSKKPAVGRFLQGTQQGALLATNNSGYTDYVEKTLRWTMGQTFLRPADFGRVVSKVLLVITGTFPGKWIAWQSSDGITFVEYTVPGIYCAAFRGQIIYIKRTRGTGTTTVLLYGFY